MVLSYITKGKILTDQISYQEYRKHITELAYKKKKLEETISKKRQAQGKYREWHREFMRLTKLQDSMTKELISLIPSRF